MEMGANSLLLHDESRRQWLRFAQPLRVRRANNHAELRQLLEEVDAAGARGQWAAGLVSYEAAAFFDPAFRVAAVAASSPLPLAWFGFFAAPEVVDHLPNPGGGGLDGLVWQADVTAAEHAAAVDRIRAYIATGDTYQTNFTYRLRTAFDGDPLALFAALAAAQTPGLCAYLDLGDLAICSASPELFFKRCGEILTARPMKGTCRRGLTLAEDRHRRQWLLDSTKDQAENVMIVDMIRNDLGRVARPGTVQVDRLFEVEKYPSVWQMTSTVTARSAASPGTLLHALFPCASITGAPKVRTMQIIAELERSPRGVYTGTIGYVAPNGDCQFNVAIRTVVVDRQAGRAEYGVGGGIVWDSSPAAEYRECQDKAAILSRRVPEFELLETLLWQPENGYFLLDEHLRRLAESAEYFDFPVDLAACRASLAEAVATAARQPCRVRLTLAKTGQPTVVVRPLAELPVAAQPRLQLAPTPIDQDDPFLYHKTTNRRLYDTALAACPEADDVILWNQRGELTETCTANLVLDLDGRLVTPPVAAGLLAGLYRDLLLRRGEIHECVLTRDDLRRCQAIYVLNSVRGRRPATLAFRTGNGIFPATTGGHP